MMNSLVKRILKAEFNKMCQNKEIRCLRNNVYQTQKVENLNHLINLWVNHPIFINTDTDKLLTSVFDIIYFNKGVIYISDLFYISVNFNEKELIQHITKK